MSGPHKVWGTRTDSTGTGYYRGDNGKYYYGNPRNGFLTETIDEQNKRRAREEAEKKKPAPQPVTIASSGGTSGLGLLDFIAGIVEAASVVVIAAMMCMAFVFALFYSILASWPHYVSLLVDCYSQGIVDVPVIMVTVSVAFQWVYFFLCAVSILKNRIYKSTRYLVTCTIVTTVLHSVFHLLGGGFNAGTLTGNALTGFALSCVPSFILVFLEHVATKEIRGDNEWFITKLSRILCRVWLGHSVGMVFFGAATLLLARIIQANGGWGPAQNALMYGMGGLLILMGILGRKKQ